jgi:glycosyltransferase involved in cell wall biosynthesis
MNFFKTPVECPSQTPKGNRRLLSVRISVIEPSGRLYGSEYCLLDVIRGLKGADYRWQVMLPLGQGFDELLRGEGVDVCGGLLPDLHKISRWRKMQVYWTMRRQLAMAAPDVVYLNQAGMLRAVDALMMGMEIPLVCQVQTLEDARFISRHPAVQRRVRAFICNSRFIAAEAGLPTEKQCILYQGVDFGEMGPEPKPPVDGEPWRIGILGRIADSKGHPVFLEAAARLLAAGHKNLRFVVIGEGLTAPDTAAFQAAVTAAGLDSFFELRGYRKDVAGELGRLNLLVIPSLAEPLGRVLLDACAAGIPSIVSDSGGLGEFSRDLEIGTRIPAGDSARLAEEILVFLKDHQTVTREFRAAARQVYHRMASGPYLKAMDQIIRNAAAGRNTSIEWFGEPVSSEA